MEPKEREDRQFLKNTTMGCWCEFKWQMCLALHLEANAWWNGTSEEEDTTLQFR
jgi:hypothetical protein